MVFSNTNAIRSTFGLVSFALYALPSFFVISCIWPTKKERMWKRKRASCADLFFFSLNRNENGSIERNEKRKHERGCIRKDTHMNCMLLSVWNWLNGLFLISALMFETENIRCFIEPFTKCMDIISFIFVHHKRNRAHFAFYSDEMM